MMSIAGKKQFEYILTKTKPEISGILEKHLRPVFKKQYHVKESDRHLAVVGFSGGADSIATLYLSKKLGLNPIALNLDYGFMPNYNKTILRNITKKMNIPLVFFKPGKTYYTKMIKILKQGKKPCNVCVKIKVEQLLNFTKENKIPFLVLGDFVSTGKKSIGIQKNIVRISLPGMLDMKEKDMIKISKKITKRKVAYACPIPYMVPDLNFKINNKLKKFWTNKLINWSENMNKKLFYKLMKNVVE